MTELDNDYWVEKSLFRDYLRAHPEVAEEYNHLKREWAARYGADRDKYEEYTDAKTPFIQTVRARARAER